MPIPARRTANTITTSGFFNAHSISLRTTPCPPTRIPVGQYLLVLFLLLVRTGLLVEQGSLELAHAGHKYSVARTEGLFGKEAQFLLFTRSLIGFCKLAADENGLFEAVRQLHAAHGKVIGVVLRVQLHECDRLLPI